MRLVRKSGPNYDLAHWNRRAWQEIAIIKTRIDELERRTEIDTGGDSPYAPKGDPWEREVITNKLFIGWAYVAGFVTGSILWILLLV